MHASEIIAKGILNSTRNAALAAKGDVIGNYAWAWDWVLMSSNHYVKVHALVLDFDVFYTLGPVADKRGKIAYDETFTSNSIADTSYKLAGALTWQLPSGAV